MQKQQRSMLRHCRLQARALIGIVLFMILLGAMGASLFTQRPQAAFIPLAPALAVIASQGVLHKMDHHAGGLRSVADDR